MISGSEEKKISFIVFTISSLRYNYINFWIFFIFLGQSIEHGEGFKIVGMRFIVAGIATIGLGFFAQYYMKIRNSLLVFKYFLQNINKNNNSYR